MMHSVTGSLLLPEVDVRTSSIPFSLQSNTYKESYGSRLMLMSSDQVADAAADRAESVGEISRREEMLTGIGLGSKETTTPAISVILC
jgi:hypothetical protein